MVSELSCYKPNHEANAMPRKNCHPLIIMTMMSETFLIPYHQMLMMQTLVVIMNANQKMLYLHKILRIPATKNHPPQRIFSASPTLRIQCLFHQRWNTSHLMSNHLKPEFIKNGKQQPRSPFDPFSNQLLKLYFPFNRQKVQRHGQESQ